MSHNSSLEFMVIDLHISRRILSIAMAALVATLSGCADFPPARAIRIATASTSQTVCTAVFVSGLNPAESYAEEIRPEPGIGLIAWGLHYSVDRERREVVADFAGFALNRAVYQEGMGCVVDHGNLHTRSWQRRERSPAWRDPFPGLAMPGPIAATNARIRAAIDEAFEEPTTSGHRRTKAVIVIQRGQILGERYAPGIGEHTPLPGHSVSKSVVHALIGILVRQHKIDPDRPIGLKEWGAPGDPRAAITPNQLLSMSSGLPWDERFGGFDEATRLWFDEPDPYAYAVTVAADGEPGRHWAYSNVGYTVLSRLLRDKTGGSAGDVLEFAQRELFEPNGMRDTVMTIDATGTPMGSNLFLASARDWARFGLLYLNGGMAGAQEILTKEWVKDAHVPTLDAGYGRGFWLNNTNAPHPLPGRWGMPGAPRDAYFARGVLGQYVVIVPSLDLVVVRLGRAFTPGGDIDAVGRLVGAVAMALAN